MGARRFFALIRKESLQIVRDPSTILVAVVLPLVLLFLFGFGISLDANKIKIGVVVERDTQPAYALASAFRVSPFFDVVNARDRRALEGELVAGRLKGIVVIPDDFGTRFALAPDDAVLQVLADGSNPNTARFVTNYARGVWRTWMKQTMEETGGALPLLRTEPNRPEVASPETVGCTQLSNPRPLAQAGLGVGQLISTRWAEADGTRTKPRQVSHKKAQKVSCAPANIFRALISAMETSVATRIFCDSLWQ